MSEDQINIHTSLEGGFTLLELLVTLLLVGIISVWGVPRFQALGERSAQASEVNRLQSTFSLARNTAISQRSHITVCPTAGDRSACNNDWAG
ncbi:MAG: pilus assembly FimT family protein, partial [Halomonas sp.]